MCVCTPAGCQDTAAASGSGCTRCAPRETGPQSTTSKLALMKTIGICPTASCWHHPSLPSLRQVDHWQKNDCSLSRVWGCCFACCTACDISTWRLLEGMLANCRLRLVAAGSYPCCHATCLLQIQTLPGSLSLVLSTCIRALRRGLRFASGGLPCAARHLCGT